MPFRLVLLLLAFVAGSGCTILGGAFGAASDRRADARTRRSWDEAGVFRKGASLRIVRHGQSAYVGAWEGFLIAGTDSATTPRHPRASACVRWNRQHRRCAPRADVVGLERHSTSGRTNGLLGGLAVDLVAITIQFLSLPKQYGALPP